MCYSAEVSFATWGFGMVCAAFLYFTGHPIKSFVFPLVVSQMQLVEGLRWIDALPESILAWMGKLTIYSQPVAAMVEAGLPTWMMAVYAVSQAMLELLFGSKDNRFVISGDGHLNWKWIPDSETLFLLPYWIALFYATGTLYPRWLSALMFGLLVYYVVFHLKYRTFGSLWCVSGNILWLYYMLR